MPPEILKNESYDLKVDIWSAGILAYFTLCSQFPFNGKTEEEISQAILEGELSLKGGKWD